MTSAVALAPPISELMTRDVLALPEGESLRAAVELMLACKVRHVPVLDAHDRLVGMLTDRDVKRVLPSPLTGRRTAESERLLDETTLGRIMTREPETIGPDTPVVEAVRMLHDRRFSALPVVEGHRLVGIFTEADALRLCLELLER